MAQEQNQSVSQKPEYHEHQGRRWPIIVMFLLAAFIIANGVVFGGRWVYRKVTNSSPSVKVQTTATKNNPAPSAASQKKAAPSPAPPPATNPPPPLPVTGG